MRFRSFQTKEPKTQGKKKNLGWKGKPEARASKTQVLRFLTEITFLSWKESTFDDYLCDSYRFSIKTRNLKTENRFFTDWGETRFGKESFFCWVRILLERQRSKSTWTNVLGCESKRLRISDSFRHFNSEGRCLDVERVCWRGGKEELKRGNSRHNRRDRNRSRAK